MAAKLTSEHFDNLQLLLKAPSKDAVKDVCMASYRGLNRQLTQSTAATLSIPEAQAAQILHLFPEAFHSSLRNLLTKILLENSAAWKTEAVSNQISLPQLKELDWRVDMVTSSDSVSRMCVPTCLVQFKTEDLCPSGGRQSVAVETVELSRETVDTMLDGLGRIRDQLSVVAGK
ncbi:COMM domain-containing protein 9 isoform X2 [Dunckerocampus dactyliophorus]|uniref:COMM domain-containing protein 9 isoform X2 n=1 Tax=Dunckerocampus dactyliophorus TaxID=161453 RepID=UPI002406C285|nr:COMM domain-containing protein 9 isoform X2 [Dunckerocampus dactyliophorus]